MINLDGKECANDGTDEVRGRGRLYFLACWSVEVLILSVSQDTHYTRLRLRFVYMVMLAWVAVLSDFDTRDTIATELL